MARLVVDDHGQSLNEQAVGAAWRRLQARLGIEPAWRFHQLRHFFATTCLRGGGNVEAVRRLLGHRDLASTTRYVHATERDLMAAVAALPGKGGETAGGPCP
jgi:site-specific recombinase XerD